MADAAEARRLILLVSPAIAGPVASLWTSSLYADQSKASGDGAGTVLGVLDRPCVRFTTSRTEDALDSVLPTAPEAFIQRRLPTRFNNPANFSWRMA